MAAAIADTIAVATGITLEADALAATAHHTPQRSTVPPTGTIHRDTTARDHLPQHTPHTPTAGHAATPDNPFHFSPTTTHYNKMLSPINHKPAIPTFQLFAGLPNHGDHPHSSNNAPHKNNWHSGLIIVLNQLEAPNKPQHTYVASLLLDSGLTYKDISDFRQFTHIKWNDTANTHDIYQYHCITIPSLVQKASRSFPPPATRATSTTPEMVHINAGHTGPLGNITNILQQGCPAPSTSPTTLGSLPRPCASHNSHNMTTPNMPAFSTTLGTSQKTHIHSSSTYLPGVKAPNLLAAARSKR